ncbi:hypothetical protein [Haloechinothrix halophila]|uniref:hypothetical protein n=1 Tax=Haloechinothrix halophila TaxID=1069073 RepID=UPI0003F98379|nr:hypothetical protein [Haloechinothrix halophila]
MRYPTLLVAPAAALALFTGCGTGPASGSGATTVDENQVAPGDTGQQADDGDAALGTRDNPLTLGTRIEMGDWTLAVTDVTLDATKKVLNENPFNEKPVKGRQFVMFAVKATYQGKESGTAWTDFSWAIVGNKGNTFGGTSMDDHCGVIPKPLDDTGETFPDGKVRGNVCISAPSNQLDGATIRIEETLSFEDTRAFYALQR